MAASKIRISLLLLAVILIPVLPWFVVGPQLEAFADGALGGSNTNLANRWLVAGVGLGLLTSDSFLPVPSTLVMSGLGFALGVVVGGAVATVGVFLSGLIAYAACRRYGTRIARRITGEQGMRRMEESMRRLGPVLIAATRAVPVVQEATACLAGLTRMPFRSFTTALAIGSLPSGFAYAAIGASALQSPALALGLSLLVPVLTWVLVRLVVRTRPGRVGSRPYNNTGS